MARSKILPVSSVRITRATVEGRVVIVDVIVKGVAGASLH